MSSTTPSGTGVVLVCSGGGAHGAAQAGMLAELLSVGFECSHVVGVSAGAFNAVQVAADPSPATADRLCELWGAVDTSGILPSSRRTQIVSLVANRQGPSRQEGLKGVLRESISVSDLRDTTIPVHIGAVDVSTGEDVWFSSGPALEILCASSALPGVFPPVVIDGRQYYDGGVTDSLPLRRALALSPVAIVALDVTKLADTGEVSTHLRSLMRGIEHTREALRRAHISAVPAEIPLTVVRAPAHPGPLSLREEVEFGRTVMREHLAAHPLGRVTPPNTPQLPARPAARRRFWRPRSAPPARAEREHERTGPERTPER